MIIVSFSYKRLLYRVFSLSCTLFIIGLLLLFQGMRNIIIRNTAPINNYDFRTNICRYDHVEINTYQVIDEFYNNENNTVYFLVQFDNYYLFIESYKESNSFNALHSLIGR